MIPLLTRAEMRDFEAEVVRLGVPSLLLMENAGRMAAETIYRHFVPGVLRVRVVCGVGNNGGDGWAVGRHLLRRGLDVAACEVGDPEKRTPDAEVQRTAFLAVGGVIVAPERRGHELASADLVVDALFGTGLSRAPEGDALAAIRHMGRAKKVAALDLPSGIEADTGHPLGAAVRADLTISFGSAKVGLYCGKARALAGRIEVVDIGVPPASLTVGAYLVEDKDVQLHARGRDVHKYGAGHVLVLGGSAGKAGAAHLAARAALRTGAGLVTVANRLEAGEQHLSPELMFARLPDGAALRPALAELFERKRAVVVGPGLGLDEHARTVVDEVLTNFAGPVVIDADALTLVAERLERLESSKSVLTPHTGEMARLLGKDPAAVEADRFGAAREVARRARSVVVLKGPNTLIAEPNGRVFVNPTGSPALATAGSGDVLAGMIGALLCAVPRREAATFAAYMHGACFDGGPDRGRTASDLCEQIPTLLARYLGPAPRG